MVVATTFFMTSDCILRTKLILFRAINKYSAVWKSIHESCHIHSLAFHRRNNFFHAIIMKYLNEAHLHMLYAIRYGSLM